MASIEDRCPQQSKSCLVLENSDKIDGVDQSQLNKIVVFSLKLILIGLSSVYLFYQTIELIKLYHNYDTIVSVYYESKDLNQIPSFTVCLPSIIDKNKLLAKFPDLSQKLKAAQNDEKRRNILTEYLDSSLESMLWTQLTIQEVDEFNCTLNYWSIKSNRHSIDRNQQNSGLNCREVVKPIESYSNAKTKCFTYFSQLSADISFVGDYSLRYGVKNLNDLYEIIRIEFNLNFDRYLSLGFIENQTTIAIHHQNMIANEETELQLIDGGQQYDITINKISTKLLPKPYKTSCFDYSKNNKRIESRKQCIDHCIIDLYKEKCNCIPIHLTNTLQLLNTTSQIVCSRKDSILRTSECYEDIGKEVGLCLTTDRCPHECNAIRYSYRTKAKKLMTSSEEMDTNVTDDIHTKVLIRIRSDESRGDTFVTHVPLMTFGQLLAHICALLALFSGLSVIGITNLMVKSLPPLRLNSIKDDSHHNNSQQMKRKAKQWFTEKSRCSTQSESVVQHCIASPKRHLENRDHRRPATSTVYDTDFKTITNIDIKTHDI